MHIPDGDYYDYWPTLALARPLVLGGAPGSPYREVGHDLAALTGLPLIDIDRWMEHQVGQSLWDFAQARGQSEVRRMESALLHKALAWRPRNLIIAGEGTLAQEDNRRRIRAEAALCYLTLAPTTTYWQVRQEVGARGPRPYPHIPYPLEHFAQLRPLLAALAEAERAADWACAVDARSAHEVLHLLMEVLPKLAGVQAEEGGARRPR